MAGAGQVARVGPQPARPARCRAPPARPGRSRSGPAAIRARDGDKLKGDRIEQAGPGTGHDKQPVQVGDQHGEAQPQHRHSGTQHHGPPPQPDPTRRQVSSALPLEGARSGRGGELLRLGITHVSSSDSVPRQAALPSGAPIIPYGLDTHQLQPVNGGWRLVKIGECQPTFGRSPLLPKVDKARAARYATGIEKEAMMDTADAMLQQGSPGPRRTKRAGLRPPAACPVQHRRRCDPADLAGSHRAHLDRGAGPPGTGRCPGTQQSPGPGRATMGPPAMAAAPAPPPPTSAPPPSDTPRAASGAFGGLAPPPPSMVPPENTGVRAAPAPYTAPPPTRMGARPLDTPGPETPSSGDSLACANCGMRANRGDRFCLRCGRPLPAAESAGVPSTPTSSAPALDGRARAQALGQDRSPASTPRWT